jgi:hypothetical protein
MSDERATRRASSGCFLLRIIFFLNARQAGGRHLFCESVLCVCCALVSIWNSSLLGFFVLQKWVPFGGVCACFQQSFQFDVVVPLNQSVIWSLSRVGPNKLIIIALDYLLNILVLYSYKQMMGSMMLSPWYSALLLLRLSVSWYY